MKTLIAAVVLLALAVPAQAATCFGHVKVTVITVSEGLSLKGDKIVNIDGCTFVNPDAILRTCPKGSLCYVEGGNEEDGAIETITDVTRVPVPYWRPHLDIKQYEAQKQRLSEREQLSLKICLYGWDALSEQELETGQDLPGSIHCKIAAKALKKHHINLRDTFQ